MAKRRGEDDNHGAEAAGGDAEPEAEREAITLARLARGQRRGLLITVVLLVVVAGATIGHGMMLQSRLEALESGLGQRIARANDDYARIQDQTAAMRAGLELLHRELDHVRGQTDLISRRLAGRERQ